MHSLQNPFLCFTKTGEQNNTQHQRLDESLYYTELQSLAKERIKKKSVYPLRTKEEKSNRKLARGKASADRAPPPPIWPPE